MRREDLDTDINEKFLFEGPSGYGKSWMLMNIAKIYAIAGKKVIYIDPEKGTNKTKKKVFGNLTDEELDNINLIKATNIDTYLKWMLGWSEKKIVGAQELDFTYGLDCDVKVCDGLTTEIEIFKTKLTKRFVDQGYYYIGDTKFPIKNSETFTLPFQFYSKLYDQLKDGLNIMLDHNYDILGSMHLLKESEGHKELRESIFQKFDTIIKLNKTVDPIQGTPKWDGVILKNRGKESPNMSNQIDNMNSLFTYFIKKFSLDSDEIKERMAYE